MGRKKRAVHPWSSHDHALAACVQALGTDAAQEGIEAFKLASENSCGGGPNGDTYIPWVSDLLYLVERKYDVRVTGGLATLLWIASGARPLSSEDRFELSRKTWDEAIRRARRRESKSLLSASCAPSRNEERRSSISKIFTGGTQRR